MATSTLAEEKAGQARGGVMTRQVVRKASWERWPAGRLACGGWWTRGRQRKAARPRVCRPSEDRGPYLSEVQDDFE